MPKFSDAAASTPAGGLHHWGTNVMPADSGQGDLMRPLLMPELSGGRIATPERLWDFFLDLMPDPDWALQNDPNFDVRVRQQPDVKAAFTHRQLTVAGLPVHFEPSDDPRADKVLAQKVADYVSWVWKCIPKKHEIVRNLQNAVMLGGQGYEWVWAKDDDGSERPRAGFPVHKGNFPRDRQGNLYLLTRENPAWGALIAANPNPVRFPSSGETAFRIPQPGKFMYHTHTTESGPPWRPADEGFLWWGRGEDVDLYWVVQFDFYVTRFRMKWIERHGIPLAALYVPENRMNNADTARAVRSIRGEGVVKFPRTVGDTFDSLYKLEWLQPNSTSSDVFDQFHQNWTKPSIEKILLGGAETQESRGEGYSGKVIAHEQGPRLVYKFDATNIADTFNQQWIPAVVKAHREFFNFPEYLNPKMVMAEKEERDMVQGIDVLERASKLVPIKKSSVYNLIGEEPPAPTDPVIEPPADPFGGSPFDADKAMGDAAGPGRDDKGKARDDEGDEGDDDAPAGDATPLSGGRPRRMAGEGADSRAVAHRGNGKG